MNARRQRPVDNWLAIIGVLSLMYWAWQIIAAFQHRGPAQPDAAAAPVAAGGLLRPADTLQGHRLKTSS